MALVTTARLLLCFIVTFTLNFQGAAENKGGVGLQIRRSTNYMTPTIKTRSGPRPTYAMKTTLPMGCEEPVVFIEKPLKSKSDRRDFSTQVKSESDRDVSPHVSETQQKHDEMQKHALEGLDHIANALKEVEIDVKTASAGYFLKKVDSPRTNLKKALEDGSLKKAVEAAITGNGDVNALMGAAKAAGINPSTLMEALGKVRECEAAKKHAEQYVAEPPSPLETAQSASPDGAIDAAEPLAPGAATAADAAGGTAFWRKAANTVSGSRAVSCITDPIYALKKLFPGLDAEAVQRVKDFFSIFKINSPFMKRVLEILLKMKLGDFRPLVRGITNTIFGLRLKRVSAPGGYIGHKMTISTPFKELFIKYFINPVTLKLGVAMTGLKARVYHLQQLLQSTLRFFCIPIPGIIGAFGCLRIVVKHPFHGRDNQLCLSGYMKNRIFGDGPNVYFGCLDMKTHKVKETLPPLSNKEASAKAEELAIDNEEIRGLDAEDDEDGGAQNEDELEKQFSMFTGASDALIEGLTRMQKDKNLKLSDQDNKLLEDVKASLTKVLAFTDTSGTVYTKVDFFKRVFTKYRDPDEEILRKEAHDEKEQRGERIQQNGNPEIKKKWYLF